MGWAGNLWYGLDVWIEAEETWSELCAKVPPEKRLELIAEELVCDTRNQLERICRFIGTEYDSKMMDYVDDTTYSAPKPELTNQWKRKLSDREIRIIESRVGDMLVERGYELSGLPMKKIGPLEKSWLFYHHKVSKWKFRIRRYGFGLFVADIISRKIPISEEIRNAIRRRFHAIEYGTLK